VGQKSDCAKCTCNAHALRPRRPPRPSTPPAGRQSRCPPPAAAIWPIRAHKAVTSGQSGWRSLASVRVGAAAAFGSQTPPVLASGHQDHAGYRPDRRRGQPLPYSRSAVSRNGCAAGDLTEVCRTHRVELGRRARRPPLPLPCAQHNLVGRQDGRGCSDNRRWSLASPSKSIAGRCKMHRRQHRRHRRRRPPAGCTSARALPNTSQARVNIGAPTAGRGNGVWGAGGPLAGRSRAEKPTHRICGAIRAVGRRRAGWCEREGARVPSLRWLRRPWRAAAARGSSRPAPRRASRARRAAQTNTHRLRRLRSASLLGWALWRPG